MDQPLTPVPQQELVKPYQQVLERFHMLPYPRKPLGKPVGKMAHAGGDKLMTHAAGFRHTGGRRSKVHKKTGYNAGWD